MSYKSLMGQWVRNDDNLAHIAHVDGEYKVNMIFYQAIINAPEAMFYVETSGLTEWRKSLVIRGVYNECGRGGRCGHGRGRARTARATKVNETEEQTCLMTPPLVNQKQMQVIMMSERTT